SPCSTADRMRVTSLIGITPRFDHPGHVLVLLCEQFQGSLTSVRVSPGELPGLVPSPGTADEYTTRLPSWPQILDFFVALQRGFEYSRLAILAATERSLPLVGVPFVIGVIKRRPGRELLLHLGEQGGEPRVHVRVWRQLLAGKQPVAHRLVPLVDAPAADGKVGLGALQSADGMPGLLGGLPQVPRGARALRQELLQEGHRLVARLRGPLLTFAPAQQLVGRERAR